MVNEPMPRQLTVEQLIAVLKKANPKSVVCLEVPAGGIGHDKLKVMLNLKAVDTGPMVKLQPNLDRHE